MKIIKPKDLISKNLKILIYGASGTGKTYLAGSVEKGIVLDLEKGSASVKNKNIDVAPIDSAVEFKQVLEEIKETNYESIVIDALTRYGEMLFVALTQVYTERKDSMALWQDFDKYSRQRIEDILAISKNIIVTCLEEQVNDGGILVKHPMYKASKFKFMLPSYFDVVARIVKDDDGKRQLVLEPTSDAIGKNRLVDFNIPIKTENNTLTPDLQKIINKIKGV